jgi:hypothetical protein
MERRIAVPVLNKAALDGKMTRTFGIEHFSETRSHKAREVALFLKMGEKATRESPACLPFSWKENHTTSLTPRITA